jgi:hypothetical protein
MKGLVSACTSGKVMVYEQGPGRSAVHGKSAACRRCRGKVMVYSRQRYGLSHKDEPVAPDHSLEAVSVVKTDHAVPDPVLVESLKNQAIRMARPVEFIS